MAAHRCPTCKTDWPNYPTYAVCPECLDRCDPMANAKGIPVDEAESRARHAKFDRQYTKREETREGPTPEEIGQQEAKLLAQQWRDMESWLDNG